MIYLHLLLSMSLLLSLIAAKSRRLGMRCPGASMGLCSICRLGCRGWRHLIRPRMDWLSLFSKCGRCVVFAGLWVAWGRPNHLLVRHHVVYILKIRVGNISTMMVAIIQRYRILVLYITWWSLTNTQITLISLSASSFKMEVEGMRNFTYPHRSHWFIKNVVGAAVLFNSRCAIM